MIEVGAYEAKTHLSNLLEKVAKGELVKITRHGVPIAILSPAEGVIKKPVDKTIDEIKKFRKGHKLAGLNLQDMIKEGRR